MKKTLLILLGLCVAVIGLAQAQQTETRQLETFTKVHVSEGIDANLIKGDANKAIVTTKRKLEDVVTRVKDGTLEIEMDDHLRNLNMHSGDVKVTVYFAQALEGLSASSGADLSTEENLQAEDMNLRASSAGSIMFNSIVANEVDAHASSAGDIKGNITSKYLTAHVSSAGKIQLKGAADNAKIEASSSGDFKGKDLQSKDAMADASSGADVWIRVSDHLKASASSGGDVHYYGAPEVSKSESSGGDVTRE